MIPKGKAIVLSLFLCLALLPASPTEGKNSPLLYPVLVHGKWGYINRQAKIVISPQFDEASDFSDGLADVEIKSNNFYMNENGKIVAQSGYHTIGICNEGICGIGEVKTDKFGFIDKEGKIIIELRYELVGVFSEGLAAVRENKKWGYIDRSGNFVLEPKYSDASYFKDGLAIVQQGHKEFFIDKKGTIVIDTGADDAKPFSEGLAAVKIGKKWGFIDKTGKIIIKPQFAEVGNFKEGLAKAAMTFNGYWGYIDKTGQFIIKPQFDQAADFSEGLAAVLLLTAKPQLPESPGILNGLEYVMASIKSATQLDCWKYIDKKGKQAIPGCFSGSHEFHDGIAQVSVARNIVFFLWDGLLFELNLHRHCVFDLCDCGSSCYEFGYIKHDGTYLWPLQN